GIHFRLDWKTQGDPRIARAHFSLSAMAGSGVRPRALGQIQSSFGPLPRSVASGRLRASLGGGDSLRSSPGGHRFGPADGMAERTRGHGRAPDSGARRAPGGTFTRGA